MNVPRSLAALALALSWSRAGAQASATATDSSPKPASPAVVMSGLLFANYQYQLHGPARDFNQFVLDRAYLTARATLGKGLGARITADVFQNGIGDGWDVRLKYGYLQYDRPVGSWETSTRAGMLQNVMIDHVEQYWPRFLAPTATDRAGFHSSADIGVAERVTLPGKLGEIYATIVNGNGYTRREADRFKDFSVRLSLTPLASSTDGFLSTLALTGWVTEGARASRFILGGAGQVRAVREGLRKDRYGAVIGVSDPRLSVGAEYAVRRDEIEEGDNTPASPRGAQDRRGTLGSAFAVVRPAAFVNASGRSPFGLVARYDDLRLAATPALGRIDDRAHFLLLGALYDVNSRLSVALDYQETLTRLDSIDESRALFAQMQLSF